jgi:hypothetical protein
MNEESELIGVKRLTIETQIEAVLCLTNPLFRLAPAGIYLVDLLSGVPSEIRQNPAAI